MHNIIVFSRSFFAVMRFVQGSGNAEGKKAWRRAARSARMQWRRTRFEPIAASASDRTKAEHAGEHAAVFPTAVKPRARPGELRFQQVFVGNETKWPLSPLHLFPLRLNGCRTHGCETGGISGKKARRE